MLVTLSFGYELYASDERRLTVNFIQSHVTHACYQLEEAGPLILDKDETLKNVTKAGKSKFEKNMMGVCSTQ